MEERREMRRIKEGEEKKEGRRRRGEEVVSEIIGGEAAMSERFEFITEIDD
jgi:hypothetical protein